MGPNKRAQERERAAARAAAEAKRAEAERKANRGGCSGSSRSGMRDKLAAGLVVLSDDRRRQETYPVTSGSIKSVSRTARP